MRVQLKCCLAIVCILAGGAGGLATRSSAQRVQLPGTYGATSNYSVPPGGYTNSGASLGPIQPFDPYALPNGPTTSPTTSGYPPASGYPSNTTWPAPPQTWPPVAPQWPAAGLNGTTTPYAPSPTPTAPGYAAPGYGQPAYGQPAYGQAGYAQAGYGQPGLPQTGSGPPFRRLFQDTGFRYAWLAGDSGDELQMHEVEVSTTAFFPNFLRSNGPLRVTPGFALHLLDGPAEPAVSSDLPAQLYSAYLDFGWNPQFSPQFGADVTFRTGVFSDFETFTTESLRFMGTGVGIVRITPATALKLGGAYIDRAKLKFLPAAGILWTPNAQTRWDIFFPSPKLASYWTTVGNSQIWWYVGAEYGGGSWTFDRPEDPEAGASERVDINDIRVFVGLEWQNMNRWYGFIEAGYVFDREVYYVVVPTDRVEVENTVMLRAGVSF